MLLAKDSIVQKDTMKIKTGTADKNQFTTVIPNRKQITVCA